MGSISHHVMPLVINTLRGRHTHTDAHAHTHTHTHTNIHIHTCTHPHRNNFRKPGARGP